MKLLFLNHNYRFNGTYYRAMPMAEQLAARGHEVTLMTVARTLSRWPKQTTVNRVRLIETPNWGRNRSGEGYRVPDNLYRLAWATVHRYDIVHMFDHKPNASFPGITGRLRGATLVADWADWWGGAGGINDVSGRRIPAVGRFEQWWEERSKRWADGVVTISTVLSARAASLGIPVSRILYLPTGAATERIHPVPLAEARARLGVPIDRRIVGFIGMGQGDLDVVMNAMCKLDDVWLMVIGKRAAHVHALASQVGVAHRLWQTDFVGDEQVSTYLGCANIMVLPLADTAANRGRLPNKLLDYFCAGRATIASPVGDVRMIFEHHDVGMLAENAHFPAAIAHALENSDMATRWGEQARSTAETVFAWPRLISELEAFYESLRRNHKK